MTANSTLCVVSDCYVPGRHGTDCRDDHCSGCLPGLARDGLRVCAHHHDRTLRDLAELPGLEDDLGAALVRRSSMVTEYITHASDSPGINLDDDVLETRERFRGRLTDLAAYVVTERGVQPPEPQVRPIVRFLTTYADWLDADQYAAPNWGRTITNLKTLGRRFAYRQRKTGVYLGDCPIDIETVDPTTESNTAIAKCAAPIRFDPTAYAGENLIACRRCGTTGTVDWWQTTMAIDPATTPLLTARDLVLVLAVETHRPITEAAIRQWAHRGHIQRHGADTTGRQLYNRTAVIAYATTGTREVEGSAA